MQFRELRFIQIEVEVNGNISWYEMRLFELYIFRRDEVFSGVNESFSVLM